MGYLKEKNLVQGMWKPLLIFCCRVYLLVSGGLCRTEHGHPKYLPV